MDSNSLNVLVEAKKEYLTQLYIVICPAMIEIFEDIYNESVKISKGKKTLIQFQKLLKEVANWNDHMVHNNSNKILSSCNWFNDLLAAVFVSSVKILSSVRLNANGSKISLKMPNNKVFIHGCFIAAAKDLYKNPYIYHDESIEQERDTELTQRFSKCIDTNVKDMLPVQEILKSCMSQAANQDNIDIESTMDEEEEDDPEVLDEDEVENIENKPTEPSESAEEQQPTSTEESKPVETEPQEEGQSDTRNINFNNKNNNVENENDAEDDVLFPDAK